MQIQGQYFHHFLHSTIHIKGHYFLCIFAVHHVNTGAILFMGRRSSPCNKRTIFFMDFPSPPCQYRDNIFHVISQSTVQIRGQYFSSFFAVHHTYKGALLF
jgi:hypothetical protein